MRPVIFQKLQWIYIYLSPSASADTQVNVNVVTSCIYTQITQMSRSKPEHKFTNTVQRPSEVPSRR